MSYRFQDRSKPRQENQGEVTKSYRTLALVSENENNERNSDMCDELTDIVFHRDTSESIDQSNDVSRKQLYLTPI